MYYVSHKEAPINVQRLRNLLIEQRDSIVHPDDTLKDMCLDPYRPFVPPDRYDEYYSETYFKLDGQEWYQLASMYIAQGWSSFILGCQESDDIIFADHNWSEDQFVVVKRCSIDSL